MALKSKQITFNFSCGCTRFTPITIMWLNTRGGWDTYTFRLQSTRTIESDKKEWSKYLSSLQPDLSYSYNIGDRGRSIYDVQSFETVSVVSQWQRAPENAWVAELFNSPEVYKVESGPVYYPVIVTSKSVDIKDKTGYGERLLSHKVEFTYSYQIVRQRA